MVNFALISLLLMPVFSWAKVDYGLADLEVLVSEGSFDEFFAHAHDVRPSERQDAWKGMVSKMADGLTKKITRGSEVSKQDYQQVERLFHWPSLKDDAVFRGRRQEIGLSYLKHCLKTETPCWKEVKAFWEADSTDADTAFKLAEIIVHKTDSPIPVWTFIDVAVKSPLSEFYCKKDFVLDAVWGKLEIDYIRLGQQGDFLKKIDSTVHPDCLRPLNERAKNQLLRPNRSSDREMAFQFLHAQGKTDQATTDFFYAVYLLENPSKGDLFNLAWNRLSELAKTPARREVTLSKLKALDPLPDELFASLDLAKKRAILNHFNLSFPEYLLYYSDQCVSYYGGRKTFENGNPATRCQDLMNSELGLQYLGKERVDEFNRVRKI